jgi:hypothetical protein
MSTGDASTLVGKDAVFDYPAGFTNLPAYSERRGQVVCVKRVMRGVDEGDPMYEIEAADGWRGHAYASELAAIEHSGVDLANVFDRDVWAGLYTDGGVSLELTHAEIRALLASVDPALAALQGRVRDSLAVDLRTRDIAYLAVCQHDDGDLIDVPTSPCVSEGDDNGAYVSAWLWVSFDGTSLDKEPKIR